MGYGFASTTGESAKPCQKRGETIGGRSFERALLEGSAGERAGASAGRTNRGAKLARSSRRGGVKRKPEHNLDLDPADFDRGWQCYASSFLETNFLEHVVKPLCDEARLSLLLSQAGGSASAWLRAVPTEKCFTLTPLRFQVAVRRRLRWNLPLSWALAAGRARTSLTVSGTTLQRALLQVV